MTLAVPTDALGDYVLRIGRIEDAAGNSLDSLYSTDPLFPGPFSGNILVNRTPLHVLNSFTLSPPSVNVTAGTVDVTATCSITTTSGEFSYGFLNLSNPEANGSIFVYIGSGDRTAGSGTSGDYSVTFPVPRYLSPGLYAPSLDLRGTVGGSSRYATDEFAFPAGATGALTVANTGAVDLSAPVISFVSATPNSIPSGSATPLVARIHVTDDVSGVNEVYVYLTTPGASYYLSSAVRISGTERDGLWELTAPLPPNNIPPGVYAIQFSATDHLNQ